MSSHWYMPNSFGVMSEGKEERREKNKIEIFMFDYLDYEKD